MAINLTTEQHTELEQLGTKPMQVVDPVNQKIYFVVSKELFERVRGLFEQDPFDISETYRAQEAALAEVWDDPALDVYNNNDTDQSRS